MKALFAIATAVSLIFAGPGFAADKKSKSPKLKEFPGQRILNGAFNDLTKAQREVTASAGNIPDAIIHLKNAQGSLKKLAKGGGKGSTAEIASRLTGQAIKDLERDSRDEAAAHIEKAIANVRRAGEVGAR